MRLQWFQCVLVKPLIECLFEGDGDIREVQIRLLVYCLRVKDCCWYEAWVLRCKMLLGVLLAKH
jgi:hypothetical protein